MANYITTTAKLIIAASLSLLMQSCIKEEMPTSVISRGEVESLDNTQLSMLYGLSSYMVSFNSWGSSGYYLNDWGFPCQMYFREVNGEDFPVYNSTYDYWTYHENGSYASSYTIYSWYYYYKLIRNCNNLIGAINPESPTITRESLRYLGSALAFRAMAYMDLARMFEFKPTGYQELDDIAQKDSLWGLTVPIVTEKTTELDGTHNPRVPYWTIYRFIMTDLKNAQSYLNGYNPDDNSLPGADAVNGLMARAWLEMASRLEENTTYINNYAAKLTANQQEVTEYVQLGSPDAAQFYQNAYDCARAAMQNHTFMDSDEWHDPKTGFNKTCDSWIWRCRMGNKEQFPTYYCTFLGQIASEPEAGLAYSYNAYRCIGDYLYGKIKNNDWRKTTWIAPADTVNSKAKEMIVKYQSNLDSARFINLPAYANLKFRPGEGNTKDYNKWLVSDLPVMRAEEMEFIMLEAQAHISGYADALAGLKSFLTDYRYKEGTSYTTTPLMNSMNGFLSELLIQKRIEFWGEGICYFDYKRLNLQIDRSQSSNYESSFQLKSRENSVAPWLNYYIPTSETQRNNACKANPDVSGEYN